MVLLTASGPPISSSKSAVATLSDTMIINHARSSRLSEISAER